MKPYASYKPSGVPWLGDVPAHWIPKRLKHMGQFRAGAGFPIEEQGQSGNLLPFFKVRDIDGSNQGGVITTTDSTVSVETANRLGARVFPKNSIVFAKVGAALLLNRFRLLGVDACIDNNMMSYMVDADEALPEFMYWAMQRINFSEIVNPGTVPSLNEPLISNLFMASPPPDEQQAIANYLDVETARIDTLTHEKDELVGLLKEWRQSVIAEVVTKGLDKTAAMKPSGVPWLGDVPSHWNVQRIKRLSPVRRGASPRPIDDPIYFDDNGRYGWVRIEDVTRSNGILMETSQYLSELGASLSVKLPPGRLFLSIAGSVGKPCISGRDVCIHDGFVYFPDLDVNTRWMFGIFESGLPFQGLGKMGTQLNLNTQTVGDIFVGTPPADEQQAIADYLDAEAAKIDDLIAHTHEEITLLKELRAATIADAVLGRIDVRTIPLACRDIP